MAYHVRRTDRKIDEPNDLKQIIKKCKYATIAMCKNNEPYLVTLSYGYDELNNSLYFHGLNEGQKIDFLKFNPSVCMTIIDDKGYIENECGHSYRSIVIRGKIEFINDETKRIYGIKILINHFEKNPDLMMKKVNEQSTTWVKTQILKLNIDEIVGKERSIVGNK